MIEEICDRIKTVQISDSSPSLSPPTGETINSEEESVSNRIRQVSPSQGTTLPILQKIINLSDKIQNLKKEHSNLSNQVKTAKDSFLGPNNLDTLQKLVNEYELLKKKYLQELSERKRLYNEVIELKGNIKVFCRCRPLNQVEITHGSNYVVEFDSSQDNELQIISSDSSKKQFKFDHVFGPEDNQEAVFAQTKPIVASVLDGYNVCIFHQEHLAIQDLSFKQKRKSPGNYCLVVFKNQKGTLQVKHPRTRRFNYFWPVGYPTF
uniref:Kinesin motor domain-containing protein n=1 Tax=Populus trichocarpa TaxID=3694 RepID=B9MZX2_POPTR